MYGGDTVSFTGISNIPFGQTLTLGLRDVITNIFYPIAIVSSGSIDRVGFINNPNTMRAHRIQIMNNSSAPINVNLTVRHTTKCDCDPWGGTNGNDTANLRFRLTGNDSWPFHADIYQRAANPFTGWNGSSSKVNISWVQYSNPGTPNVIVHRQLLNPNFNPNNPPHLNSLLLAEPLHRRQNGDLVNLGYDLHQNWHSVEIHMEQNIAIWRYISGNNDAVVEQQIMRTFRHEVGHILKLGENPGCSSLILSVMYQLQVGNANRASFAVTQHDKDLLIKKWGR